MKKSNPHATHILVKYRGQNITELYRADDGICIGALSKANAAYAEKAVVVFGDEPNKRRSHLFLDNDFGYAYLTETVAAEDLKARGIDKPVEIEEREGIGIIELPPDSILLPGNIPRPQKIS